MVCNRRMIPKDVEDMLDASGVEWKVEKGGKHHKLYIDGAMVSPLSTTPMKNRTEKNFRARIKRHLAKIAGDKPAPVRTPQQKEPKKMAQLKDLKAEMDKAQNPDRIIAFEETPEHINRLVELFGYADAADAIGMSDPGLRNAISSNKVKRTVELAAKAVLADLESKKEKPKPITALITGMPEEMALIERLIERFDVTVTPFNIPT